MSARDNPQRPQTDDERFLCVGGPLDGQMTDAKSEEFYEALLPTERPEPHTTADLTGQARVHVYRFDRGARVFRWQGER